MVQWKKAREMERVVLAMKQDQLKLLTFLHVRTLNNEVVKSSKKTFWWKVLLNTRDEVQLNHSEKNMGILIMWETNCCFFSTTFTHMICSLWFLEKNWYKARREGCCLIPHLLEPMKRIQTRILKDKWMKEELYDTKENNQQVKGLQVPSCPVTGLPSRLW